MVFFNILNLDSLVTEQNSKKSIFSQHPNLHTTGKEYCRMFSRGMLSSPLPPPGEK